MRSEHHAGDSPRSRAARPELRELLEEVLGCVFWPTGWGNMQLASVSNLCPEQTPALPRVPSCPSFTTAPSPGKKPRRRPEGLTPPYSEQQAKGVAHQKTDPGQDPEGGMGPGGEAPGHQSVICIRDPRGVEFEDQSLRSGWARGLGVRRTHPTLNINMMELSSQQVLEESKIL